jgi:hypothetical protein
MITPTSDEASAMNTDSNVMKVASECPNAKSPSNITAT